MRDSGRDSGNSMTSRKCNISLSRLRRKVHGVTLTRLLRKHLTTMDTIRRNSRTKKIEHQCKMDIMRVIGQWVESSKVNLLKELLQSQDSMLKSEEAELRRSIAEELRRRLPEGVRAEAGPCEAASQAGDGAAGRLGGSVRSLPDTGWPAELLDILSGLGGAASGRGERPIRSAENWRGENIGHREQLADLQRDTRHDSQQTWPRAPSPIADGGRGSLNEPEPGVVRPAEEATRRQCPAGPAAEADGDGLPDDSGQLEGTPSSRHPTNA